jgi:dTDP-4-amino-4,6-dideoxygalactose transaminase
MIPYGRQTIDDEDVVEVIKALKSPWLTQGPLVEEFEKSLAEYCGTKYAVVVANGTAALQAAYYAVFRLLVMLPDGLELGQFLWILTL